MSTRRPPDEMSNPAFPDSPRICSANSPNSSPSLFLSPSCNGDSTAGPTQSAERTPNPGWFKLGNVNSVKHQLYTERDLQNLKAEVDALEAQSVADDGGEMEITARRRSLHAYRARIHRRIIQLDNSLEARGLFDGRGKLRVVWISKLESLIATARAIDSLMGLGRRQKAVPSLSEYLDAKAQERTERKQEAQP